MPLPLLLGIVPVITGVASAAAASKAVGKSVKNETRNTIEKAEERHKKNIKKLEIKKEETENIINLLEESKLEIVEEFKKFSEIIASIKNKPYFNKLMKEKLHIPGYNLDTLINKDKDLEYKMMTAMGLGFTSSFAAGPILTSLTSSVLLGPFTLGIGILAYSLIDGYKTSKQADEAWEQMTRAERKIKEICNFLDEIKEEITKFHCQLKRVDMIYFEKLRQLDYIVNVLGKRDWNYFTEEERLVTQNTISLTGLLFHMCKISLVIQASNEQECGKVNREEIEQMIEKSEKFICTME